MHFMPDHLRAVADVTCPAIREPCMPPALDSMLLDRQRFMEGGSDLKKAKLLNN